MQSKFVSQTIGHYMQAASRVMEVSKVGAGVDDGVGHIDILDYVHCATWSRCLDVQSLRGVGGTQDNQLLYAASHDVEVSNGGADADDHQDGGVGNPDDVQPGQDV